MMEFYIGKRLSFDDNLCSVKYIGQVAGTKGNWLGVEWDDPTRGKHAGIHNGVRYFECEKDLCSEIRGAFVLSSDCGDFVALLSDMPPSHISVIFL